jgi:tetratricopeptide (TPR) repeat protein/DNA-binding CsgD family transcriptional regulator
MKIAEFNEKIEQLEHLYQSGSNFILAETEAQALLEQLVSSGKEIQNIRIRALLILSPSFWRRGLLDKAIAPGLNAFSLAEQIEDKGLIAKAHTNLGNIYKYMRDFDKSISHFQQAISIYREIENKIAIAVDLGNLGSVYLELNELNMALDYNNRALMMNEQIENSRGIAQNNLNLGNIYYFMANYMNSLEHYERALKIFEQMNLLEGVSTSWGNIANIYKQFCDYTKAMDYYNRALELDEKLGNKTGLSRHLLNLGNIYQSLQQFENSIKFYKWSLRISEEIGNYSGMIDCYCNLGYLYKFEKKYQESIQMLNKAYDLSVENKSILGQASSSLSLGILNLEIFNYSESKQYMDQAYKYALVIDNKHFTATVLINLGILYFNPEFEESDFEKAENLLFDAIRELEVLGMKREISNCHYTLSEQYKKNKQFEKALEYFTTFFALYQETNDEEVHKQAEKYHWERSLAEAENEKKLVAIQNEAERRILEEKVLTQKQLLERKETEINKNVEELIRKNTLLQHIMSGIRKIQPYVRGDGNQHVESLMDRINRNITPLEGNKQLDQQITEVYSDMMDNLKGTFPDLTIMELRIACLISMKLTSANIATVLFLSKRTVESHRLSLRKKMHLQPSDDIYSELQKYGARKSAEQVTLQ